MESELIAQVTAFGDFDGVDLADQVGDGGVRGGQLLAVALGTVHPGDGGVVAQLIHRVDGSTRDRVIGVVVDF
jgi:hypothetical protein